MIEIKDETGCNTDGGEEGLCAAVISDCDALPVLEFAGHILDHVATLVELPVESVRTL